MTCRSGYLFLMYLIILIWKMELPCDESCRDKRDVTVTVSISISVSLVEPRVKAAIKPVTNY